MFTGRLATGGKCKKCGKFFGGFQRSVLKCDDDDDDDSDSSDSEEEGY